jgi:hypothetical protein
VVFDCAFGNGGIVVVAAVPKECGRESRLSELGECFDEGRRSRGKIWDQDVGGRSKSSERTNEGEQKQETRKG